jgi:hypothetical protein
MYEERSEQTRLACAWFVCRIHLVCPFAKVGCFAPAFSRSGSVLQTLIRNAHAKRVCSDRFSYISASDRRFRCPDQSTCGCSIEYLAATHFGSGCEKMGSSRRLGRSIPMARIGSWTKCTPTDGRADPRINDALASVGPLCHPWGYFFFGWETTLACELVPAL